MADRHIPLGPVLWRRINRIPQATLERNAWDAGVASAADAFDRPRSAFGAAQVIIAALTALVASKLELDGLAWEALVVVAAALLAYWFVPTLWAFLVSIDAPPKQRDEARASVKQLRAEWEDEHQRVERPQEAAAALEPLIQQLEQASQRWGQSALRGEEMSPQSCRSDLGDVLARIKAVAESHGVPVYGEFAEPIDLELLGDSLTKDQVVNRHARVKANLENFCLEWRHLRGYLGDLPND